jgi:hypothetical protein
VFFVWPGLLLGQGTNDRIVNRILLVADTLPTITSTVGNTIEWDCINKALTNKCLVYHNDQWFTFMVDHAGSYFLNISNQECRDQLGIQVILLEGDPCKTSTYRVLKCIPKTKTEDYYIELDSLRAGVPYLINIDGFLGDYCRFAIQLATQPYGIPLFTQSIGMLKAKSNVEGTRVTIDWEIDATRDKDLEEFRIYRTVGKAKGSYYKSIPVERNTVGVIQTEYSLVDSLEFGTKYVYRILGLDRKSNSRYWTELVIHSGQERNTYKQSIVYLYPKFKTGDRIQINILDGVENETLDQTEITYDAKKYWNLPIDLGKYIAQNRLIINIIVRNLRTGQVIQSAYAINRSGEWEKK